MNYRIHRTIYVTDLVIEYKNLSGLRWDEILQDAFNTREINRFLYNSEYKLYAKRLSSLYMDVQLYECIEEESNLMRISVSKYITLLLHDYVSQINKNVSRETL